MNPPKLNILIADDHALIREGLKRILVDASLVSRIGEAANAAQALEAVRREKWDVVVLDLNLGSRSGLEVLKTIRAEFEHLPVLVLSMYPEEQFAVRVLRAGANAYVNKNQATRVLILAIRQVLAGGLYVSPKVAEQLVHAVQQPEGGGPLHAALSDREDQVLRLIAAGHTAGEIAGQLNLSVKTVSTYRGIVLRKLGVKNNAQLMRYAQEHELEVW